MGVLSDLEPAEVFQYFEEICHIPHGSGNTKAISDYCVDFAKRQGLRYQQDDANNVIIWKDGSPGHEQSAPVMLQGHLDMVCEKEADCGLDFSRDGLELQLEDGVISAKGTTLGGDDGIAVAYALAILASDTIAHPPLEVVLTVDEEIGMLGAAALDASPLQSRIMLNLDSEEEGYLLVSCAGGITTTAHLPIHRETADGQSLTLTVTGLQGGHSGVEIDKGRGNACQLLGRALYQLQDDFIFRLCSVQGGLKDNAIPREAVAELVLTGWREKHRSDTRAEQYGILGEHQPDAGKQPSGNQGEQLQDAFRNKIAKIMQIYQEEYQLTDSNVRLLVTCDGNVVRDDAIDGKGTAKIITMLYCLPGGIQKMSFAIEDLVQTSLNLGILKTEEHEVTASFSIRSSVETEKLDLVAKIQCLMESLGGRVTSQGEYPAWEYRQDSPLRDLMVEVFREQYEREPVVQALHAGVECGLFAGKLPGLDCVSFGPDMRDIHTPKESMDVESVKRTWLYTLEVLKRL
ncbi:MAG: aminoacyl-histidine dipeptidase [Lachnospiraceae bacterium]|nr:aminoacyl-histidine dipeptidase [Lachnospiraceae bacterium]